MGKNDIRGTINKTAIKNFAIYSRSKLIKDIKNKAALIGITESGIQEPLSTSTGNIQLFDIGMQEPYRIKGRAIEQRNALIKELKGREKDSTYETAYKTLIEEVSYTWFNRIIAIRFMEVNNYMPDRMRILSSGVEGINEPEFITHIFETSFEFSEEEKNRILELKMNGSNLAMDELFQHVFIKQCNALNINLPELFEKTNDYTELLLTVSYNDVEGIIYKLVHDVPESDFDVNSENSNGQVEIIGWLYQFYNTEPKATVFSRPKLKKIEKQDIPAATQLFTPEWIVKYMVENFLGRVWIEKLLAIGDSRTEKQIARDFGWKYYIPEAKQEEAIWAQTENLQVARKNITIEEITFLDPAMGSFHIGIYAFEVFMQIYESEGYTTRESAKLIVEKNLHGLDIDKRASQLSYFACMMQARKYNRRILEENLQLNVYEILESNHINMEHINYLGNDIDDKEECKKLKLQLVSLLNILNDAKEYGSLLNISETYEFPQLRDYVKSRPIDSQVSLLDNVGLEETQNELLSLINVAEIISKKYDVVVTNPPYMGSNGMDDKLSDFAKRYYPDSKADMFAMFIERSKEFTLTTGVFSMITQHAWMFLTSYEFLRLKINGDNILNMVHLGPHAFEELSGEKVQSVCFTARKQIINNYTGSYIKLTDFNNALEKKNQMLLIADMKNTNCVYYSNNARFQSIEGMPLVYWISDKLLEIFEETNIGNFSEPRVGMATAENDTFLRLWYEVDFNNLYLHAKNREEANNSQCRWFPITKGGAYRLWYGNNLHVVNWENDGYAIRNFRDLATGKVRSHNYNLEYIFQSALTWTVTGTERTSFRFVPGGSLYSNSGYGLFTDDENILLILALLNSPIAEELLNILSPTMGYESGYVRKIPYNPRLFENTGIDSLVQENIQISKDDWDDSELSWDFLAHPLVKRIEELKMEGSNTNIDLNDIYENLKQFTNLKHERLKNNTKNINEILVGAYGLNGLIDTNVSDKGITISKIVDFKKDVDKKNVYCFDKRQVIVSLISYFVGCLFGRYSLKHKGIMLAGNNSLFEEYDNFKPVEDNVILITDQSVVSEDIVTKFIEFVKSAFGEEKLETNLQFISTALDERGGSPQEIIRNYFVSEFYIDHKNTYSFKGAGKMPIYWLYDSGKQNGFKALIYMHRYNEDTTGKVRVDYLHQAQKAYERTIANLQEEMVNSKDAREITQIQKKIEKLTKQLKECKEYDERLGHIALERIPIDLDDGVKVNYQKVQTDSKGEIHQILASI